MNPKMPPVFIPFPTSDPYNLNLVITGLDGYGWYYDFQRGGFVIMFYGQYTGEGQYQIVDGNGNIIDRGSITPFNAPNPANGPTVVNVALAGGIKKFDFVSYSLDLYGLKYDSATKRNDTPTKAAVLGIKGFKHSRLYMYAYNLNGSTVEVKRANPTSKMDVVSTKIYDQGYGSFLITTEEYLDDAIITVIPPADKSDLQPFHLYFYRNE
jgi:hypothetical protein